ncbi:mandelate racemase/muconate lactonizing protein [Candidatus Kaiserbacteria bacterium RIFCSPHIGHO2_02_FULL_50_9]|uniref:Mandelate racemase/muconate lactonizing protein n=1 Tax=Candidatus Kaiserbacteria bacterium RIFCSPLOWO2_01_FULL_51_21 TaxID=1798508 RepID=A0A1F6EFG9_9BACT|nr:MAG: mandelate racemase/muconate lactonizing protein [Candidatus Kaiserbacteria bacterium RIFCSPHIGHO2_01_FULL_51_33]OGG63414.1 MAG: mandelate racemase/muconate lactonizing protein [Candidatus Kaiserbacteria bacterium RIFCSPHIGHO2_02_FULL_50_9]OGG72002.1 MAG: mandelate racemase/muconate lactonizing protein [Candidatus Kaiserbacteria bacterium RIFCSPLOWO2_01_FULL_51_21]
MKISQIDTLHCDAGWRPWTFIKIATDEGLIGWSECTDSHGSPRGIEGVVKDLSPLLLDEDPRNVEKHYQLMLARTRQSPGSIIQKAIGGIENALLDIKGKALGVPVYELFGGKVRDTLPLYWSHCGTSRVRASQMVGKPQIKTLEDVKKFGEEVRASGFKTIKTNIAILDGNPRVYMPGFAKSEGGPELNADRETLQAIDTWIGALRNATGNDIDIVIDLNYNFKTEGYIKIGRMLEKYNLLWLEIDSYDPDALRMIKNSVRTPISSCENLYGVRQYRPFFEKHAMDIASVDIIWNGFIRSKQIADMAEIYEMNVTPHNYNGHLSTFISAQFCALIPNLRIMEYDVDDVPWREELFTNLPKIEGGRMEVPKGPGWGTEVNEKVLHEHPWPKK